MNTRLYDQLQKWVTGKPPLLGLLSLTAVFSCDTFHALLNSDEGKELLRRCSARNDEVWGRYYASPVDHIRDLIQEVTLQNSAQFLEVVDAWQKLSEGNQPETNSTDDEIVKASGRFLQYLKDWSRIAIKQLVTEEDGPDDEEMKRLSRGPAFCFFLHVTIPCCLLYQEIPQTLYATATRADSPNLSALNRLVGLDREIIHDLAVRDVLHTNNDKTTIARFRHGSSHLSKPSKSPSLKEVKKWMAGLVSYYADYIGSPLQGPDIRQLFDYVAVDQSKGKLLSDPDLPASPESLAKMLRRSRECWEQLLPLPPDKNFAKAVQALRGDAA